MNVDFSFYSFCSFYSFNQHATHPTPQFTSNANSLCAAVPTEVQALSSSVSTWDVLTDNDFTSSSTPWSGAPTALPTSRHTGAPTTIPTGAPTGRIDDDAGESNDVTTTQLMIYILASIGAVLLCACVLFRYKIGSLNCKLEVERNG